MHALHLTITCTAFAAKHRVHVFLVDTTLPCCVQTKTALSGTTGNQRRVPPLFTMGNRLLQQRRVTRSSCRTLGKLQLYH